MPKDNEHNDNDIKEREDEQKEKKKFVDDMKAAKQIEVQNAENARRGTTDSEG